MPRVTTQYDVFISSPSDVATERDIVSEAIDLVNETQGTRDGFMLNPIRWDKDVSSQFGASPQDIVNEQVGDDYDLFIGILCAKFGEPTDNYGSGTEEEFELACERKKQKPSALEIMFYFKEPRKSSAPIDADQLVQVSAFKKRIGPLGVYEAFETHDILKTKVIKALGKAVDRLRSGENTASKSVVSAATLSKSNELVKVSEFDEDIGMLDLTEIVVDAFEELGGRLGLINNATVRFGRKTQEQVDEIKKSDQRENNAFMKPRVDSIAKEMRMYAHIVDQETPNMRKAFSTALHATQHAVLIANTDGLSSKNDIAGLAQSLAGLKQTLGLVYDQIASLRETIDSTPRLTTRLNQAKRTTVGAIDDFLRFISETSVNIETTLDALQ